jgi:hypothetical protein
MKALGLTLVVGCLIVAVSAPARAEPIDLTTYSTTGGVSSTGDFITSGSTIDLGTVTFSGGSSESILVDGLKAGENYTVSLGVVDPAARPWTSLTVEILDPTSDGFDANDPQPQPSYVPAGYSTSNNEDGLSFAWNAGLERSATFASGGQATLFVDEDTDAHDLLRFDGFSAGTNATVTFGLRDRLGDNGFLLRLSTNGDPAGGSQTPEPASMLLLGTGLAAAFRSWLRRQLC